tara:strand:+ start:1249 stop:1959 length:711 start_codon:yes stop_codon:yes gene_type:complete
LVACSELIADLSAQIVSLESAATDLRNAKGTITRDCNNEKIHNTKLNNDLKVLKKNYEQMKSDWHKKNAEATTLNHSFHDLGKQKEILEDELTTQIDRIKNLEFENSSLQQANKSKEQQLETTVQENLIELERVLHINKEETHDFRSTTDKLHVEIDSLLKMKRELENSLTSEKSSLTNKQTEVENLNRDKLLSEDLLSSLHREKQEIIHENEMAIQTKLREVSQKKVFDPLTLLH